MKQYYLYITASRTRVLYTGVTNDLHRRVQHKSKSVLGFTKRYCVTQLVYYEMYGEIKDAIRREKKIKAWRRDKKIVLIESMNPKWKDLGEEVLQG